MTRRNSVHYMIPGNVGTEDLGTTLWEPLPKIMEKESFYRKIREVLHNLCRIVRHYLDMPKTVTGFGRLKQETGAQVCHSTRTTYMYIDTLMIN